MVTGAAADTNVVPLGNGVLLRNDALARLLVKLDAAAEIFFRAQAKLLALDQGKVCVDVDLEGTSEPLVLLFDEDREAVAAVLG